MVHPYLRRRQGLEEVIYPSDAVREVLEPTLGVPIFQEQVIKLAMVAAGFTGGEADQLRRSMAAWRRRGKLTEWQERLTRGMLERGYDLSFAERICRQIEGFGEYGFPESHAASFALLVYYSAWLKHYEPAIFCAALLNAQPMGFYSPSQLVKDLREHKHEVLPVCVNRSDWFSSIEQVNGKTVLRLGLHRVRNLSEQAGQQLVERRPPSEGYQNLAQLRRIVSLNKGEWDALAAADALHSLTGDRRSTRWALLESRPDLALGESEFEVQEGVVLPQASAQQELEEDYQHLGLSLRGHPIALLRSEGKLWRSRTAEELMHLTPGKPVRVCGLVVCRQRPGTASGVTFVTLEDETGNINLIVWQATARAQRQALIRARLLQVDGILQREGSVIHVVAGKLTDRTDLWQALDARSRDFH
jgi:error-prone DNA polymerase